MASKGIRGDTSKDKKKKPGKSIKEKRLEKKKKREQKGK